jgi:hypothetical protein
MTAAARRATQRVPLLDAFCERAEARAYLFHVGEYSLTEAVDVLQADAVRSGLVAEIGQDGVQAIIAQAFARVRR